MRGLGAPEVQAFFEQMGGRLRTPHRMRGKGWTVLFQGEQIRIGRFKVDRVLLHLLGAPGPVKGIMGRLSALADRV